MISDKKLQEHFKKHPRQLGLFLCVFSSVLIHFFIINPLRSAERGEQNITFVGKAVAIGFMMGAMGILYLACGDSFAEWMELRNGKFTWRGWVVAILLCAFAIGFTIWLEHYITGLGYAFHY